jgi:hypothetical protein
MCDKIEKVVQLEKISSCITSSNETIIIFALVILEALRGIKIKLGGSFNECAVT